MSERQIEERSNVVNAVRFNDEELEEIGAVQDWAEDNTRQAAEYIVYLERQLSDACDV